jgi:hypothetical protein
MIQITAQMRVLVAIEPVDWRKGIDSLSQLCQEKLAGRSILRMCVRVSEPQWNGDPTAHLRRPGIRAGPEATFHGAFRMVAGRDRAGPKTGGL